MCKSSERVTRFLTLKHIGQVLCIQGFLACRKHADRIILLVEMMQSSGCPCFKAGPRAVAALRKRFHLTLPESQVPFSVAGPAIKEECSANIPSWKSHVISFEASVSVLHMRVQIVLSSVSYPSSMIHNDVLRAF